MVLWGVNDRLFAVSLQAAGSCFLRVHVISLLVSDVNSGVPAASVLTFQLRPSGLVPERFLPIRARVCAVTGCPRRGRWRHPLGGSDALTGEIRDESFQMGCFSKRSTKSTFVLLQDKKTFLLVLDGKTFQELGRANVPVNMPYGFHGIYEASP